MWFLALVLRSFLESRLNSRYFGRGNVQVLVVNVLTEYRKKFFMSAEIVGVVISSISMLMSIFAVASGIFFYVRQEHRYFEESLPDIRPINPPQYHQEGQLDLTVNQNVGWRNVGKSTAQNFYAVLFGGEISSAGCYWQHSAYTVPTIPETPRGDMFDVTQPMSKCIHPLRSSMRIGGHTLYVSPWHKTSPYIARFTATYHDLYGRKCLSVWDYNTKNMTWVCKAKKLVKKDLLDLQAEL